MKTFVFFAAVTIIAVSIASPAEAATPSFQRLGYHEVATDDYMYSYAYDVSADGSVVIGSSSITGSAISYRWTVDGGMVDIGNITGQSGTSVKALSADGSVLAGYYWADGNPGIFRWTATSMALEETEGDVFGISADGNVVVGHFDNGIVCQAFRWTTGEAAVAMGYLPGHGISSANASSADGSVIVGNSRVDWSDGGEAYRWTAADGMIGLGVLPGASSSWANSVSNDGSVVFGNSGSDVFRWTEADGMVGLEGLMDNAAFYTQACSADGSLLVGSYKGEDASGSFLWTEDSGMQDLQVMLAGLGLDVNGWGTLIGSDVSADGTVIVGYGTNPDGNQEAWMATIPEPASLCMLALGVLAVIRRRS